MLYLAISNLNSYNIVDVENTDYTKLIFPLSKAAAINKKINKAIINGIRPERIDFVLGYILAKRLVINCDKNIADMVWNNSELFNSLVNKELKTLVYWLNEYIEINDIYNVIAAASNILLLKLKGENYEDSLVDDEQPLANQLYRML